MRKAILIVIGLFLFTSLAYAGNFNFGVGTYEQYDDILVVNSLGDEPSISTFGKLGTNDFIPENAFKNTLGYEGYSVAYDYNPTYAGLYSGIYEKALPTGVALTKIQIGGLAGNPRAIQDVYVLTSEYNRLSAQGQAISIDNLNNGLSTEISNRISGDNLLQDNLNTETTNRIGGDKLLQKNINKVENKSINRDNQLGKRIDKETNQRIVADTKLDNKITNETQARKTADKTEKIARIAGDKKLHNEITDETNYRKTADKVEKKERILGDKKLQKNINVVDTNSRNRDNVLQNNINNEAIIRGNADNTLQNNIDTETTGRVNGDNFLNSRINDTNIVVDSHSKTLQNHEQRINTLEETQYNVEGVLRILDTKKTTIEIYNTYDTGHSREVAVGVRVTYKLGKSYQDKVNEKTETRLTNLEKQIGNSPIITKVVDTKGNTKSISITANGLSVDGKF